MEPIQLQGNLMPGFDKDSKSFQCYCPQSGGCFEMSSRNAVFHV